MRHVSYTTGSLTPTASNASFLSRHETHVPQWTGRSQEHDQVTSNGTFSSRPNRTTSSFDLPLSGTRICTGDLSYDQRLRWKTLFRKLKNFGLESGNDSGSSPLWPPTM